MQNMVAGFGSNFPAIELPPPRFDDLAPLREAFRLRRTDQTFSCRSLEPQTLSDLLWAACGVNPASSDDLNIVCDASASNAQEIDIFVAMEQGLYLYDPERARLAPVLIGDLRAFAAAPWLLENTFTVTRSPGRIASLGV